MRTRKNIILNMFMICILLYLFTQFIVVSPVISKGFLTSTLIISAIGLFLFTIKNEPNGNIKGQYFKISTLFLLGFVIVHFQMYLEYVVGNYENYPYDYLINYSIVNKACLLAALALFAFFIGYLFKMNSQDIIVNGPKKVAIPIHSNYGLIVLCYLLFVVFIWTVNPEYLKGGYGAFEIGVVAGYTENLLLISIISAIMINCRSIRINGLKIVSFKSYLFKTNIFLVIIICLYLFLVLFSGDRGPIFQIGLSFFGGYIFVSQKKIKFIYILLFIIAGILFISFLGVFRTTVSSGGSLSQRIDETRTIDAKSWRNQSVSTNTFELATSVRAFNTAVDYVENHGYSYGEFQLYQIIGSIPGLGLIVGKASGGDFLTGGSAEFITKELHAGWGMGTTCIADIYLDFGVIGVILVFFLFGVFLRFIDSKFYSTRINSLWTLILIFIYLQQSVYIGRSTILSLLREAVVAYILLRASFIINRIFFRKL